MRQLSTPCLFSDHDHCTGHVHDLYGDEQLCACPCHYHRRPPARGSRAPASSRQILRPRQIPKAPPSAGPEREREAEPQREPPILGLPSPVHLLLMLALAALLYLALCVITTGVANAAAFLLSW